MKKETVKWIVKALLAGLAAFAVLCAACAFYFNVPVRVSNPDGTTEYRYEPNRRYFRGTEGFGTGRTNNEGFNNLRDYKHGDTINILLMGSSHMEGFCVPQADSAAAVLNRLFGGEKYVYNIGMAAHTFPYCAEHLDKALSVYAPTDAVVIELAKLGYAPAELDAAADGTLPEIRAHEGGIVTAAQKIPYLRLFYTKYFQGGGDAAADAGDGSRPRGGRDPGLYPHRPAGRGRAYRRPGAARRAGALSKAVFGKRPGFPRPDRAEHRRRGGAGAAALRLCQHQSRHRAHQPPGASPLRRGRV